MQDGSTPCPWRFLGPASPGEPRARDDAHVRRRSRLRSSALRARAFGMPSWVCRPCIGRCQSRITRCQSRIDRGQTRTVRVRPRVPVSRAPCAAAARASRGQAGAGCGRVVFREHGLARTTGRAGGTGARAGCRSRRAPTPPTSSFPSPGRSIEWHDDYGTTFKGVRQLGNAIGVAPGTPVVAAAAGRVQLLWHGSGGWSLTLTTAERRSVRLPAPGPRRQPQDGLPARARRRARRSRPPSGSGSAAARGT